MLISAFSMAQPHIYIPIIDKIQADRRAIALI